MTATVILGRKTIAMGLSADCHPAAIPWGVSVTVGPLTKHCRFKPAETLMLCWGLRTHSPPH